MIGLPCLSRTALTCAGCLLVKPNQLKFPKSSSTCASRPLQLTHADLCGPFRVFTLASAKYFALFVDDYSQYMWIYLLHTQSAAFQTFCHFKNTVEKQTGLSISCLRSDRDGEFTSNEFNTFYQQ